MSERSLEVLDALGGEFRRLVENIGMGMSLDQARRTQRHAARRPPIRQQIAPGAADEAAMRDAAQEQGAPQISLGVNHQVEAARQDGVAGAQPAPRLDRDVEVGDELVDAAADQRRQVLLQEHEAAGAGHPGDARGRKLLGERQQHRQLEDVLAERVVDPARHIDEDRLDGGIRPHTPAPRGERSSAAARSARIMATLPTGRPRKGQSFFWPIGRAARARGVRRGSTGSSRA